MVVDAAAKIAPVRHFAVLGAVVPDAPLAVAAGGKVDERGRSVDSTDFAVHAALVKRWGLVHGAELEGWVGATGGAGGVRQRHSWLCWRAGSAYG